jgi:hypothetical protein
MDLQNSVYTMDAAIIQIQLRFERGATAFGVSDIRRPQVNSLYALMHR